MKPLVTGGRFHLGYFPEPLRTVNPLDADLYGPLPVPRFFKNLRLKEWQHFALVNDHFYVSLALFNAKVLALAQVCVYLREEKKVLFYEKKVLPWRIALPEAEWNSEAFLEDPSFEIFIHNHLAAGLYRITFQIESTDRLPAIKGSFVAHENLRSVQPQAACLPLNGHRALYSHKAILPLEGELQLAAKRHPFSGKKSFALVDTHKGFYPYAMKWHWATGGGRTAKGSLVGFNLTNNQVRDQKRYNENCLWVDGKIHRLPPVRFEFNRRNLYRPWRIRDEGGRVDLAFSPQVVRAVDLNAILIRSRYRGPFGIFEGFIRDQRGKKTWIKSQFGMCEDFYLRC